MGAILVGLELIESDLLSSQDSTLTPSSDLADHPLPQNEALLPPSDATIKTMDLFHKISDLRGISTTVIDILDDLLLYEKLERKTVQLVPTLIHPATAMESTFSQLIPSCPVLEGIAIQVTGDTKEVSSDMKLNVEESKIKLIFSTLLSYSSYDSASMKEAEGNKYVPEGGKVIEISMETIVEHFSSSSRLAKSTARKNTRSSLIFPESFTPSNPPRRSSSIALPPHPVASTLPMPIGTFRVRIKDYRVGRNAHDFDCFSSTEQSTLKFERLGHVDGAGSGFKIWIAHKFMDLHHGRVSVETFPLPTAEVASSGHETSSIKQEENKEAAVGSGLLFTIDFPLYVVENRKLKDENEEEEARSLLRDLSGTDLLTPLIAPKLRLSQIVFANVSNLLSRSSSGASSHRGSCSVAATNEYKAVDEMKGLEEGKREEVEKEKVEDVLFQQIKEEEKEEEEATKLPVVVVPIYSIKSMPSMNRVSMDAYSSNIQKRLHILIVDDSAMVRKITSKVLTQYGYSYEEAKDGDEAVEMVRKSIATPSSSSLPSPFFDVILMDQQMPNMLGTEVVFFYLSTGTFFLLHTNDDALIGY